jgi:hypothetical protein
MNFAMREQSHSCAMAKCSGIVGHYDLHLDTFVPNLQYQPVWPGWTTDPPSGSIASTMAIVGFST